MTHRVRRQPVLIALHGDGFVECFAEKNIDFHVERVPYCPGDEVLAEDTFEQRLPRRYRDLFWPGKLRASAMNRPLKSSVILDTIVVNDLVGELNRIESKEAEVYAWTL